MVGSEYLKVVDSEDFYISRGFQKEPQATMHHHRSYEIYCLVEGAREYFIEDRFFMVEEGDLVVIPPKSLHRTAGEGGLRILLHFTDKFLQKFFTPYTLEPILANLPLAFRGDQQENQQVRWVLEALLSHYTKAEKEQTPLDEHILAGYLYQLLFLITQAKNCYVPHDYTDDRITQIVQYINENYGHINDIEQIAERFFISKYHLCRFFRKNLGIPLVSYLNMIKVREACTMIKKGYTNMTEVALLCGFNSSSYFCKVFKKEKGISPTEYRKKCK